MKNDFDKVFSRKVNGCDVEYGLMNGSNTIFVIKAGLNGSLYGYENKYLDIAKDINEKYGYTVLNSSNPEGASAPYNSLDDIISIIYELKDEFNFDEPIVYYMGHSNGALLGAWFGKDYPVIKRMLFSNAPLTVNPLRTKNGLNSFSGEKLVMAYSKEDPSYKYSILYKDIPTVEYLEIEGEDHNYTRGHFDFRKLPYYIL